MKKILLIIVSLVSASHAFADTNCVNLVKKTVGVIASGSISVPGRYGVEISDVKESALKKTDAAGLQETIKVTALRATAFFGSHGMSYQVSVAPSLDSGNGCSILKITADGIR